MRLNLERAIDSQLEELKKHILIMGGHVEKALHEVILALLKKEEHRFDSVHKIEDLINEDQVRVDNFCIQILAKQSPVAKDLRMIMSIIKINTDLERMGDQATNIAYTAQDYLKRNPVPQAKVLVKMSEIVRKMVKESLDSFVRGDVDLAKKILLMDDEVDSTKNQVFRDLTDHMKKNSQDVEASLDVILMARNLERLGDHATNIAEDVIYAVTGQDIRHGGVYDR